MGKSGKREHGRAPENCALRTAFRLRQTYRQTAISNHVFRQPCLPLSRDPSTSPRSPHPHLPAHPVRCNPLARTRQTGLGVHCLPCLCAWMQVCGSPAFPKISVFCWTELPSTLKAVFTPQSGPNRPRLGALYPSKARNA